MSIKSSAKSISVVALGLLVFAALGPAKWVPRSGLGWQIDHIVGYLVFTCMFCLAWPRPLVVGGALVALAVLLEGLQAFTPDRHPDLDAALYSAGAVLTAALVAEFSMRARAPRQLTFFITQRSQRLRLLRPDLNNARAALLTAFGRAHLVGSALARGVAPQSPDSVGLVAQPIPARLRTGPLLGEYMVSSRNGTDSLT
jgi:VanZ family protein